MRARVDDPQGPPGRRRRGWWLALAIALAALPVSAVNGNAGMAALAYAVAFAIVVPLRRRPAPRDVDLTVEPGRVVLGRGGRSIAAREVLGASTAALPDGRFAIALALDTHESAPVLVEVDTAADAARLTGALGVGHDGAGWLTFRTEARLAERIEPGLRAVVALAWFLSTTMFLVGDGWTDAGGVVLLAALALGALLAMVALARNLSSAPSVVLMPSGITIARHAGPQTIPWKEVASVHAKPAALALATRTDGVAAVVPTPAPRSAWVHGGMTPSQRTHLVAQIEAAVARARGEGAPRPETGGAPLERLRRAGASARDWLARLDMMASALQRGGGYRDAAAIDEEELWRVVTNVDADAEARAGAARILVRVAADVARPRVEEVLATVRSDADRQRIRVALDDDIERAAAALEEVDAFAPVTRRGE